MAYSTTYSKLQGIARQAVGLSEDDLTADEQTLIEQAPNEAVELVALSRRWPRLVKDLSLPLSAGDDRYVLPADFSTFERDSQLAFSPGTGYAPLSWTDYGTILSWRAGASVTAVPCWVARGPTVDDGGAEDGRETLEFYPTAGADYTLVVGYRRIVRGMAAADDVPDLPLQLHRAVRTAAQIAARELFDQSAPEEWEQRLDRRIAEAARVLIPQVQNSAPLAVLRGMQQQYPSGKNRELDPAYPYLG